MKTFYEFFEVVPKKNPDGQTRPGKVVNVAEQVPSLPLRKPVRSCRR